MTLWGREESHLLRARVAGVAKAGDACLCHTQVTQSYRPWGHGPGWRRTVVQHCVGWCRNAHTDMEIYREMCDIYRYVIYISM